MIKIIIILKLEFKMKKKYLVTLIAATSLSIFTATTSSALAAPKEQGSSNGQPFQTLQAKIDVVQMNLDDAVAMLQDQIDTLVDEQADQDALIAALQSALAALEARVTENENDIAAIQAVDAMQDQLIAALTTQYNMLEARVSDNENDIAALINADQALQLLIDTINNQISVINSRINANDGDISILQFQVSSLQTQVNNLTADLATKQNRVNSYCAAGSSIRVIHANGTVTCEVDNISAGVGSIETYTSSDTVTIPNSLIFVQYTSNSRYCSGAGYKAVGGGYSISGAGLGIGGHTMANRPTTNGWYVKVRADTTFERTLTTYVQCAKVQ